MVANATSGTIMPNSGGKNPLIASLVSIKNMPHTTRQNSTNMNPNFARLLYLARLGTK